MAFFICKQIFIAILYYDVFDLEGWVVVEAVTANKYYIANGSVGV